MYVIIDWKVRGRGDLKPEVTTIDQITTDDDGSPLPTGGYKHLREGVERFFITDINNPAAGAMSQSTIPCMWDAWGSGTYISFDSSNSGNQTVYFNHIPGGSNVLYMDGHVEFVRVNEKMPLKYSGFESSGIACGTTTIDFVQLWGGQG